jgi:hypothetical protein
MYLSTLEIRSFFKVVYRRPPYERLQGEAVMVIPLFRGLECRSAEPADDILFSRDTTVEMTGIFTPYR